MLFSTIKLGVGVASSIGASKIVSYAVKAVVPANISTFSKVTVGVGTWALSGVAGLAAWQYSDGVFDATKKMVDSVISSVEQKINEQKKA